MSTQTATPAYIINKYDFFGVPSARLTQDYPDELCICSPCFNTDLVTAAQIVLRALYHDRRVTPAHTLPEKLRPQHCHICNRPIPYPAATFTCDRDAILEDK